MLPQSVSYYMEQAEGIPKGYPQVATFIGNRPEMAIVRRFGSLNARNILYLQAELMYIEKQLLACEKKDAKSRNEQDPEDHRW
jgi:hypothetical protein